MQSFKIPSVLVRNVIVIHVFFSKLQLRGTFIMRTFADTRRFNSGTRAAGK